MIKKSKLLILFLFLIVLFSSVSAIGAADSNATDVQAVDGVDVELEQSDYNVSDVEASDDDAGLEQSDYNVSDVRASDDDVELGQSDSGQDVLSVGYTFADLNDFINSSESLEIILPHGFTRSSDSDDYRINVKRDNLVIDGNGNTIYGLKGSNIIGFRVSSKNVVIKNIVFEKMRTSSYHYNGAAIGAEDRSLNLTVINCRFIDCYTGLDSGGAVANCARVENCNFTKCYSGLANGGAAYNSFVIGCNFINNHASAGGALYDCSAVDCIFKGNRATSSNGGAMHTGIATNCTFIGNTATSGSGGAMYIGNAINCTFKSNTACDGGAFHGYNTWYEVINCTFEDNHATNNYGASTHGYLVLCTFNNNNTADYNHKAYESSDVQIPSIVTIAASFELYRPHPAVIPIDYTFKGMLETYHFSNINVALELHKGTQVLGNYYCLSGTNWTQNLDKGSYSLWDKAKNRQICTIDVYGYETIIKTAADVVMYVNDDVDLVVNLTDENYQALVGYFVYLKQGSTTLNVSRTNGSGQVSFSLKNIPAGVYDGNVYVEFIEDDTYAGTDSVVYLVVNRHETSLNAGNVTKFVDEDTCLVVNLTDKDNNPIENCMIYLKENGNTLESLPTDKNGQVRFSLENVPAGVHDNIYVEFSQNNMYAGANLVVRVVINKHGTVLKADNVTAFYNEGKITAKLTDESGKPLAGSDVILTVSYLPSDSLKTNKTGEIEYSLIGKGLAVGNHDAKIEFIENGTHKGSNISINVNLYRLKSTITAQNISFVYGESGIVTAYLNDSNGNPIANYEVHLLMSDSIYELRLTDSNGLVEFDLSDRLLLPGTFEGNIHFETTNRYLGTSVPVNVTVNKISTEISAPDVTCMYGEGKYLVVTLKDKYGNPVANESVSIKSTIKTQTGKTDGNGKASFLIDLPPKSYSVAVSFSGNAILDSASSNANVVVTQIVEKVSTVISAGDLVSVYNEGKYMTITLKDDYGDALPGKDLSINFNGKTKTYKTDSKGQVKLSTASLVPKKYRAMITFSGDNTYRGSSFTVNLVVKKANPYLFVSKKKFNKKTSVKKYKVTLKTNKNVAMKNVKISLKVKGKTYVVKTNKNGQAIFKLKGLSKKGTYKAVVTYKGNSCYNKVVKNAKITVR